MRRSTRLSLAALAVWLAAGPVAGDALRLRDNFAAYPPGSDGSPVWEPETPTWRCREGLYEQPDPSLYGTVAYRREPAFADCVISVWFRILPEGGGVKAAGIVFRSVGGGREYWAHFDARAGQLLLQLQETGSPRTERDLQRCDLGITLDQWHKAEVECRGRRITVTFDGRKVLEVEDDTLLAGKVGLRAGEGHVLFDNFRVRGSEAPAGVNWKPRPMLNRDYQVICQDAGAGGYEAFPDMVRLGNGDLLCVFYAGYGHVSLPNDGLPNGARVCAVRSTDEGRTWGPPTVVADTPWDDRDPHICRLADGTVVCNWFTYYQGSPTQRPGEGPRYKEIWLARSTDNGHTWGEPELIPATADDHYGVSAPIRELPDGTLAMPIYKEFPDPLRVWSLVTLSNDGGRTWSAPYLVDPDNDDNDEPDIIARPDGSLLCVMRSNRGDNTMWRSVSRDGGRTWTKSAPIGFPGHAPYLLRTSAGITLCAHRLPNTSLHYSLDEGETWSGNVAVDDVIGAYPSLAELADGCILIVYYEEGEGSSIRAQTLRVTKSGVDFLPRD